MTLLRRSFGMTQRNHFEHPSSFLENRLAIGVADTRRNRVFAFIHVHLPTAFADDSHDPWVRDGRSDSQRLVV